MKNPHLMKYKSVMLVCITFTLFFVFPFLASAKTVCCALESHLNFPESEQVYFPREGSCNVQYEYQVGDQKCATTRTPPPPVSAPPPVKTYKPILQIPIPGISFSDITVKPGEKISVPWIAQYIVGIYNFSLYIAAIIAVVVMMIAGFMWLTAAGNQATIGRAKEYMANAAIGLVILLSSYLILRQINPKLVDFSSIKMQVLAGGATCGPWKTQSGINSQCQDVAPELFNFLVCLQSQLPEVSQISKKPYVISSISASKGAQGCKEGIANGTYQPNSPECPHATTSCHYGGPQGNGCTQSYAVDIVDDDGTSGYIDPDVAKEIIDAAKRCSVNFAIGPKELSENGDATGKHQDHVHLSVGKKCGCQ